MKAVLKIRREPVYRREAFEKGLRRVGFALMEKATPTDASDWLVLWNRKAGADEAEADLWEQRGGTVIVCENGYLQKTDKTHYAIGVHGHNGAGWFPVGDDDRFAKLGFALKTRPVQGGNIVVRGQRGIGSTRTASPPNWARKTADLIRRTGVMLPVTVYDHPGDKGKLEKDAAALKNAHAVVIWSSAIGVRALVDDAPVVRMSPYWVCGAVAPQRKQIVAPFTADYLTPEQRLAALQRMAHGQWHFDEIASGEPFARIIENRSKATW